MHALVERWGWPVGEDSCPEHQVLADALEGLRAAGFESPPGVLDRYAAAMDEVAGVELAHVPDESLAAAVRYVVLGVVLNEPVLLAMRRLAEQAAAWRQVAEGDAQEHGPDAAAPADLDRLDT